MGKTGDHLWLWYCIRCIKSEFYVLKCDAVERVYVHESVYGHKSKFVRAETE